MWSHFYQSFFSNSFSFSIIISYLLNCQCHRICKPKKFTEPRIIILLYTTFVYFLQDTSQTIRSFLKLKIQYFFFFISDFYYQHCGIYSVIRNADIWTNIERSSSFHGKLQLFIYLILFFFISFLQWILSMEKKYIILLR